MPTPGWSALLPPDVIHTPATPVVGRRPPAAPLLAAVLAVLASAGACRAQQVTLRSNDGTVTVTGPLVHFDRNTYTIRTMRTELNLPAAGFKCGSPSCPGSIDFGIHGSNTVGAELMPRLIEAYAGSRGGRIKAANGAEADETTLSVIGRDGQAEATIDLQAHGSGTATPGLVEGKALIGMASRPLNATELAQLDEHGLPDMRRPGAEHVVALDGILVIVAPANPVTQLSLQQLQGIFSGTITDWSQVGGQPGPMNLYARDAKSGTFDTFKALVLDPGKRELAAGTRRFESSTELSDVVAKDAHGIGFIGFAYLRNAKALSLVNDCGMVFPPDTFNVKTEEYPLSRRLFLYTPPLGNFAPQSLAAGLLDFSLSLKAQPVVRESGFIDQELEQSDSQVNRTSRANLKLQNPAPQGAAPRAAVDPAGALARDIVGTSRISTTLRFRTNSTALDNKALHDIEVVGQFLRFLRETRSPRRIVLAGFSDAEGGVARNVTLALDRANAVKQALIRKDPRNAEVIDIRGYGPELPVGCNDSDTGREKNRRVELWLSAARPGSPQ